MKLYLIGATALAFAFMAIAGGHAHAASPIKAEVTCDRFGCSDWHKPAKAAKAAKRQRLASRHPSDIGTAHYGKRRAAADVITVGSAMGPITVSPTFARKILPLIAELKDMGFAGIVRCYAETRGNHVPNSLHFSGNACDFLPSTRQARGHNRMPTPAMMFSRRVADAIARAGLRNGCSFRDCGHVDIGSRRSAQIDRPPWPRLVTR